ncbi:MAG: phospholipid carrier-dependent glycosyltransferase [Pyrinomonadaceae bacterium]
MAEAAITAGLRPELFAGQGVVAVSRSLVIATLAVLVVAGFGLRVSRLGVEGLSEDELNKLQAVSDYREHGLTSANGEHPLLMKALLTGSLVLADRWNSTNLGGRHAISPETALRLPGVIFGALTAILIYLLASELFGAEVGLIAAALWTFDPSAIGFNRIAKEDTFLLFFFLLANVFWLRGQRVAESQSNQKAVKYYWATAATFGAMLASKYLPQLITITIGYYWAFQAIPATRWRLGKRRMLTFFGIMGVIFVALNPPILWPATWQQMGLFAGQKLVAHDGYEFMGRLYSHRMTDWLYGTPWYFYQVFVAVKLPLLTFAGFVVGLPLLFLRKLGDGRYFLILWLFLWLMIFGFAGGKFTRYFTVALPAVLITSAVGVQFVGRWISSTLSCMFAVGWPRSYIPAAIALIIVVSSGAAAVKSSPHFRLYTNVLGAGGGKQGYYFPHDEFYDASMREVMFEIARRAKPEAKVASESTSLASYYARRANRPDLVSVFLSDPNAVDQLNEGDFVIDARGRRYFSNESVISALNQSNTPTFRTSLGSTPSASVYLLDKNSVEIVREAAHRPSMIENSYPQGLRTGFKTRVSSFCGPGIQSGDLLVTAYR